MFGDNPVIVCPPNNLGKLKNIHIIYYETAEYRRSRLL
jgi:hypothetical protein